ncbi:MAG: hypothetical protein QXL16_00270 [Candidatus Micrarchaeaceae archaeon]
MATYDEAVSLIGEEKADREIKLTASSLFSKDSILNIESLDYDEVIDMMLKLGYSTERMAPKPSPQVKEEKKEERAIEESAIKEIGKIISKVEVAPKKKIISKESKFILPTLSLQEQIEELSKICEGVDEKVFSPSQLDIINQEVKALYAASRYERIPEDEHIRALTEIRNKKLEEAITKLMNA